MPSLRNLIVTGATGKQGGALINALLTHHPTHPFHILAVTRDISSPSAQALASKPGVSLLQGDLNDCASIFKQVQDPWGVFGVQLPLPSAAVEEKRGKALVDAASAAGVAFFVYTSADRGPRSDDDPTAVAHFASKFRIEQHLKRAAERPGAAAMGWAIVRPVAFMENLTPDFVGRAFATMWRLNGERKLQLVSAGDVGRVAALAFLETERYRGRAVALAGDELTQAEAARIFREEMGGELPTTFDFVGGALKLVLREQLGTMFHWFKTVGFGAPLEALRKEYPFLQDFRTWLRESSKFR